MDVSWLDTEKERQRLGHKLHLPNDRAPQLPGTWGDTIWDKPACDGSWHVETLQAQQKNL